MKLQLVLWDEDSEWTEDQGDFDSPDALIDYRHKELSSIWHGHLRVDGIAYADWLDNTNAEKRGDK